MFGQVQNRGTYVAPNGNFSDRYGKSFGDTQYAITLGAPSDPELSVEFNQFYEQVQMFQENIGNTDDYKNFIIDNQFRFVAPVFKPLVIYRSIFIAPTNSYIQRPGETCMHHLSDLFH